MNQSTTMVSLDDLPLNRFHIKMTAVTLGAHLTDGYSLATISTVLAARTEILGSDPLWMGLLGSSAFIGILIGSLITGFISDKVGRQKIFMASFILIILASGAQFFIENATQLFFLRVLVGIGIGGDYAVGVTLLAEFVPKKYRGPLTACLGALWTVGYVIGNVLGFFFGVDAWRWLLASAAIPAVVVLLLRLGTPESPRWLIGKGRGEEAQRVVQKYFGPNVYVEEHEQLHSGIRELFSRKNRKMTAFVSLYFVLNVIPYFSIYTFLPTLLSAFGMANDFSADLLLNLVLLAGSIIGTWFAAVMSRRKLAVGGFVFAGIGLLCVAILPADARIPILIAFALFTLAISAGCVLDTVLPSECLPTEVRASANGFATALSRFAAALATFTLPLALAGLGTLWTMGSLALVCVVGAVMCYAWCPNTEHLSLEEASTGKDVSGNPQ